MKTYHLPVVIEADEDVFFITGKQLPNDVKSLVKNAYEKKLCNNQRRQGSGKNREIWIVKT